MYSRAYEDIIIMRKNKLFYMYFVLVLVFLISVFSLTSVALKEDFDFVAPDSYNVCKSSNFIIEGQLINTGEINSNYVITTLGTASDWVKIFPDHLIINSNNSRKISKFVNIPADASGRYTLFTKINTEALEKIHTAIINVQDCNVVDILPIISKNEVCAGDVAVYEFTLINRGPNEEIIIPRTDIFQEYLNFNLEQYSLKPFSSQKGYIYVSSFKEIGKFEINLNFDMLGLGKRYTLPIFYEAKTCNGIISSSFNLGNYKILFLVLLILLLFIILAVLIGLIILKRNRESQPHLIEKSEIKRVEKEILKENSNTSKKSFNEFWSLFLKKIQERKKIFQKNWKQKNQKPINKLENKSNKDSKKSRSGFIFNLKQRLELNKLRFKEKLKQKNKIKNKKRVERLRKKEEKAKEREEKRNIKILEKQKKKEKKIALKLAKKREKELLKAKKIKEKQNKKEAKQELKAFLIAQKLKLKSDKLKEKQILKDQRLRIKQNKIEEKEAIRKEKESIKSSRNLSSKLENKNKDYDTKSYKGKDKKRNLWIFLVLIIIFILLLMLGLGRILVSHLEDFNLTTNESLIDIGDDLYLKDNISETNLSEINDSLLIEKPITEDVNVTDPVLVEDRNPIISFFTNYTSSCAFTITAFLMLFIFSFLLIGNKVKKNISERKKFWLNFLKYLFASLFFIGLIFSFIFCIFNNVPEDSFPGRCNIINISDIDEVYDIELLNESALYKQTMPECFCYTLFGDISLMTCLILLIALVLLVILIIWISLSLDTWRNNFIEFLRKRARAKKEKKELKLKKKEERLKKKKEILRNKQIKRRNKLARKRREKEKKEQLKKERHETKIALARFKAELKAKKEKERLEQKLEMFRHKTELKAKKEELRLAKIEENKKLLNKVSKPKKNKKNIGIFRDVIFLVILLLLILGIWYFFVGDRSLLKDDIFENISEQEPEYEYFFNETIDEIDYLKHSGAENIICKAEIIFPEQDLSKDSIIIKQDKIFYSWYLLRAGQDNFEKVFEDLEVNNLSFANLKEGDLWICQVSTEDGFQKINTTPFHIYSEEGLEMLVDEDLEVEPISDDYIENDIEEVYEDSVEYDFEDVRSYIRYVRDNKLEDGFTYLVLCPGTVTEVVLSDYFIDVNNNTLFFTVEDISNSDIRVSVWKGVATIRSTRNFEGIVNVTFRAENSFGDYTKANMTLLIDNSLNNRIICLFSKYNFPIITFFTFLIVIGVIFIFITLFFNKNKKENKNNLVIERVSDFEKTQDNVLKDKEEKSFSEVDKVKDGSQLLSEKKSLSKNKSLGRNTKAGKNKSSAPKKSLNKSKNLDKEKPSKAKKTLKTKQSSKIKSASKVKKASENEKQLSKDIDKYSRIKDNNELDYEINFNDKN